MSEEEAARFDPTRYLSKVSGAPYLEVKWRLLWLRTEHPDAEIATEVYSFNDQHAVFKATIRLPGGGSATGWGSEVPKDFRDYIEKAETKALGRALAALGFGTQFCPDFDFGAEQGRVVDSPVRNAPVRQPSQHEQARQRDDATRSAPEAPATEQQLNYLRSVARKQGMTDAALDAASDAEYGVPHDELNRRNASALINLLQKSASAVTR